MSTAREAFENWYSQYGEYGGLLLDRFGESGDYVEDSVQAMWTAWQAAIAQGGQGAEPIVAYRYRVIDDPQGWEYSSEPLFGPESGPGPKEEYQALTLDQLLSVLNDTQTQPAVPEGLSEKARDLCDAVENSEDLPPTKYAIRCGRLVNEIRALLETQPTKQEVSDGCL